MRSISPSRVVRWSLVASATLGAVLAWWWPGLTGAQRDVDVVLMRGSDTTGAEDTISRRIREQGMTVRWVEEGVDPCSMSLEGGVSAGTLVIFLPPESQCSIENTSRQLSALRTRLDDVSLVAVVSWRSSATSDTIDELRASSGSNIIDPRDLIGKPGVEQNCLWWDECPMVGTIATVAQDHLTEAGRQRLARFVAASLS